MNTLNMNGQTLNDDRDILATVHRVAAHALGGQTERNEGMLKLADAMGRIRQRWDKLEAAHSESQARIAELEDLVDVTRRTSDAKEAAAAQELASSRAENTRFVEVHAAEVTAMVDNHAAQIAVLVEGHANEIATLTANNATAIEDITARANREIEDVQAVAKDSIDSLVEKTERAQATMRAETDSLRGRLEEIMVENEKLVRGIGILVTQIQNTTRAMLEEDSILTRAIFDLMESMGIPNEIESSATSLYLEDQPKTD